MEVILKKIVMSTLGLQGKCTIFHEILILTSKRDIMFQMIRFAGHHVEMKILKATGLNLPLKETEMKL